MMRKALSCLAAMKQKQVSKEKNSPAVEMGAGNSSPKVHFLYVMVNGQDLKNLLHQDAVDLFRNAGYAVSLRVQHRLQVQNGPIGHRGEGDPSGIPVAMVLVPLFALSMVAAWAFMRYRQQL
ncbi:synaptojanin 2 binding protein [Phyllostomus discolor]|uniref:Synaptojanin 2 binding protein n=1 Tax=Phyllostomus discolor TaxID=89673 RepID=A0A834EU19_9CHIR|nr:synaptojanin 2 binding protein [Phyllostomus discolor]